MRTLILLFFCWSSQGRPQIGNTDPQQQQSIVSLQSGQQQFTNRLLQQIESNTTTNFVLSPHSIHSVFSQLLQGSGGQTKAELENLLGVTASDSLVEQYRILGEGLSGEGFKQANLLAVADTFKPKREYRTSLNNGFQSDIREFDFGSNSLGSVQEINRYVEDVTNQKIKDLLADDDVDGLTRMVLINAVYFKANWQFAFNADETFESSFNSPEGSVDTEYMSREADVRMLVDKERQLQILELPYEDPNRSMLIVLPNAGTSTHDLVARLDGLDLASIRTNGKLAMTSIFIPKFKLKFKTYLKQQMEQLGVRDLFARTADLSGISNEALSASEAVHQAFIEVNEEGTEAAAATAAVVGLRTAQQRKREFFADRPFLFVVYDFAHGVTLFAGKVVNPNNANIIQTRSALIQEPASPAVAAPSANSAVYIKMFRDFPNSLDNSAICNKVESEGKKLDWLRKNRALCEESRDFFNNFMSNSCGTLWCDFAAPQLDDWSAEANSSGVGGCQGVEGRVESVQTKRRCKTVKNKLKAAEFLQCRN
jgi:serpin B